jgi:hypothetical protein
MDDLRLVISMRPFRASCRFPPDAKQRAEDRYPFRDLQDLQLSSFWQAGAFPRRYGMGSGLPVIASRCPQTGMTRGAAPTKS